MSLRSRLTTRGRDLVYQLAFPVPPRLARNHTVLDPAQAQAFEAQMLAFRSVGRTPEYMAGPEGARDMDAHLHARLRTARNRIVPWLDDALPLEGRRVLEIGCGSGSSTVAFAEQGAEVVAIDVVPEDLELARARCEGHGVLASFHEMNATELADAFADQTFDHIVFYASLEHMTPEERRLSMASTWAMLKPGACWSVVEAPNRLWHYDQHSSQLPFFNWLPDELAMEYARFSPRGRFRDAFADARDLGGLYRWGRGVSFHEFDLWIGPAEQLDVVSSMRGFERRRNPAVWAAWKASAERAFRDALHAKRPELHEGFFEASLHLVIRK